MWPIFLSLTGCLGGTVDATYPGEPLMEISGEVLLRKSLSDNTNLEVTIFWQHFGDPMNIVQKELLAVTDWPADYRMFFFQPPPDDAFRDTPDGASAAFGYPMLFIDQDQDGEWFREPVVGGTRRTYIQYTRDEIYSPSGELVFSPGYSTVTTPGCPSSGKPKPPNPAETDEADLLVDDDFVDFLVDFNCNGRLEEWEGLCNAGCKPF